MTIKPWFAVATGLLFLAALVLGLRAWLGTDSPHTASSAPEPSAVFSGLRDTTQAPQLPATGLIAAPTPGSDSALAPVLIAQPDAAQAMTEARLHGDARAPALSRSPESAGASAHDMASPDNYQRYESRQNQRLYSAYVSAAGDEIPRLQEHINRAKREGISADEIRKGEEKLRRIQAMRDQLQADHPNTNASPDTAPTAPASTSNP